MGFINSVGIQWAQSSGPINPGNTAAAGKARFWFSQNFHSVD